MLRRSHQLTAAPRGALRLSGRWARRFEVPAFVASRDGRRGRRSAGDQARVSSLGAVVDVHRASRPDMFRAPEQSQPAAVALATVGVATFTSMVNATAGVLTRGYPARAPVGR